MFACSHGKKLQNYSKLPKSDRSFRMTQGAIEGFHKTQDILQLWGIDLDFSDTANNL
ncbi:MAG: hypothetical protein F6J93_32180 [Oscillatoria sp. SIO1A7]|nr:hypothetical protein [Oscillatoria sp. SIO1A7]